MKPPYQTPCIIKTKDGEFKAQLIHLNPKYHTRAGNPDKWRIGKHNFVEVSEVLEWRLDLDI